MFQLPFSHTNLEMCWIEGRNRITSLANFLNIQFILILYLKEIWTTKEQFKPCYKTLHSEF